jgi:hypothetical protein
MDLAGLIHYFFKFLQSASSGHHYFLTAAVGHLVLFFDVGHPLLNFSQSSA